MLSDISIVFGLDEISNIASVNNDNLLEYISKQNLHDIKSQIEKVAYSPMIDYMNITQLKKKRKSLQKEYYNANPIATAIGGAVGATIGGYGATKMTSLLKLKNPSKIKVPAAIAGGIIGALVGQKRSRNNLIRDLQRVDKRIGETKSTEIKKLKV